MRELIVPLRLGLRYAMALFATLAVLEGFGVLSTLLGNLGVAALLAFGFYLAWLLLNRRLSRTLRPRGLDRSLEQLVRNVLAVLVVVFGLVTVLGQFGIQLLSIITTLGVVGIAVGFAAQDTLSNFISGITLLLERPFRIGDWVTLGARTGRVEEITLRTTRLVTRDNVVVSLPNAKVAADEIVNLTAAGPLRVGVPVGIAYRLSAHSAREAMLRVAAAHPQVLAEPPPRVLMRELADSSVNLELLYWLAPEDIARQPGVSAALLESVKEALDDAGVEIPFPHLQLHIDEARGLGRLFELRGENQRSKAG